VVWIAVADIGATLTYMGKRVESGRAPRDDFRPNPDAVCLPAAALCKTQAFFQGFFELASILWTSVIGFTLWRFVVSQRPFTNR
jgi:hypothetical protein